MNQRTTYTTTFTVASLLCELLRGSLVVPTLLSRRHHARAGHAEHEHAVDAV